MAGLITYSAVLLLTRKRLERIEKLLAGKVRAGRNVNETERQVLFLARQAIAALNQPPHPDLRPTFAAGTYSAWLADGISKFAAMGAIGLEFPQEAAALAPGHTWLAETLLRGNPDPSREQVLNACTRLLARFGDRVKAAIEADASVADKPAALAGMRAYALGQACAVAGAAVEAPYIDSIEFELGQTTAPARAKLDRLTVRGAIEAGADAQVFGATAPRRPFWMGWLPQVDEVPAYFHLAYAQAAEDVYGPGARVPGSQAHDAQLNQAPPPALSDALVRDGYARYRALIDSRYAWTYGDWLAATIPMFIPSMLMLPFAALLTHGRDLRRDGATVDTERALFEALTFPFAANAITPVIVSLWVTLGGGLGATTETVFALVNAFVGLVVAVLFFLSIGTLELPAWVRWVFLFALPLVADLVLMIYILTRPGGDDPHHRQLAYAAVLRIGLALLFIVCFMAFLHFAVEGLADDGFASGAFWGLAILWLAMMFGAWAGFAALLVQPRRLPPVAPPVPAPAPSPAPAPAPAPAPPAPPVVPAVAVDPFVTGRKHYLRLFDDTTLYPGTQAAPATVLTDLHYPGERLPLLKLWWTGAGELYIRSDRRVLLFSPTDNPAPNSPTTQSVLAPIAPMTAGEYATLLTQAVTEAGAFTDKLKVERFDPAEPLDLLLPTGEVFADHGDDQSTVEAHDTAAATWRKLPADGAAPYVLYLAPRARQAVQFGRAGERQMAPAEPAIDPAPGQLNAIDAAGSVNVVGSAATRFTETFRVGDIIETTGLSPNQARMVITIADDQHLTVDSAFSAVPAASAYRRRARPAVFALQGGELLFGADAAALDPGPGLLQRINAPGSIHVVGDAATRFLDTFRVGDVIETRPAAGSQARVVSAVIDDQHLDVSVPFGPVAANSAYRRNARNREQDLLGAGTLCSDANVFRRVRGIGSRFEQMFMPGDLIQARPGGANPPETRMVVAVLSAISLEIDLPFTAAVPRFANPAPAGAAAYARVGSLATRGYDLLPPDPTLVFNGQSVLDRAADVATLLCLGVTSHLVPDAELAAQAGQADPTRNHAAIGKAQKVLRDWNLNHRRVNEWRMLVEGRAYTEPDTHPVANQLGWAPLLTRWLDMAHRPDVSSHAPSAFRPGDPSNLALSQALAYLLELPTPV